VWAETGEDAVDHFCTFQSGSTFAGRAVLGCAVGDAFIAFDGGRADEVSVTAATGFRNTGVSWLNGGAGVLDIRKGYVIDYVGQDIGSTGVWDLLALQVVHIHVAVALAADSAVFIGVAGTVAVVVDAVATIFPTFRYEGVDIGVFIIAIQFVAAVAARAVIFFAEAIFVVIADLFIELRDTFILLVTYEARSTVFIRLTPEFILEGIEILGT